jgi:hypothetical protein
MKLLFCPLCGDVRKLQRSLTTCECGHVSGRYVDSLHAEVSATALVLGMGNGYLQQAAYSYAANAPDDVTTSGGSAGYGVKTWLFSRRGAPNVTWAGIAPSAAPSQEP